MNRTILSFPSLLALALAMGVGGAAPPDDDRLASLVAEVRAQVLESTDPGKVDKLPPGYVEEHLTPVQRQYLGTGFIRFWITHPATVTVFLDSRLEAVGEPFWLHDLGFEKVGASVRAYQKTFSGWERKVQAGEVGLGIHAFRAIREHYFIALRPEEGTRDFQVETLHPSGLGTCTFEEGARPWGDRAATLSAVPEAYAGQVLVQPLSARRKLAPVYDYFRLTDFPAGRQPDQIALTLTADPRTSIAIRWRTSTEVKKGYVLLEKAEADKSGSFQNPRIIRAEFEALARPRVVNDPQSMVHTAMVTGLDPGTHYHYRVGDGRPGGWSEAFSFRTAPEAPEPFTFLYFGDVQEGFGSFAGLLKAAQAAAPEAAFAIFGGDLVSRGNDRDDWDAFFHSLEDTMARLPMVPAIGNHEALPDGDPAMYLQQFLLPRNGAPGLGEERSYIVDWPGLEVLVLDSTREAGQGAWLESVLVETGTAAFSVAVIHHGAYPSRPGRYYQRVTEGWGPLLENHGVALVLQGHDHAYLRTHPRRDGSFNPGAASGTVYLIATSGTKFYAQAEHAYTAVGFTETPTFQVIEVEPSGGRISVRALTEDGRLMDAFSLHP